MATLKMEYRSSKDQAALNIRLSYKQNGLYQKQRTVTKIEVTKSFWDAYNEKGKNPDNWKDSDKIKARDNFRNDFKTIRTFLNSSLPPDDNITKEWLQNAVNDYYNPKTVETLSNIPETLLEYWDYYLEQRKSEIVKGTKSYLKWISLKNKYAQFEKDVKHHYRINEVNDSFITSFVDWSQSNGYANSTTKRNVVYIKTVCKHAGRNEIATSVQLEGLGTKIKNDKLPKITLSFQELKQIAAVEGLPDYLDNAKDWLIISCYTGQRISDFMRFDKSMIKGKKERDLYIKQLKTGKDVSIPLMPEVETILSKRNGSFPRKISDQKYNLFIKEVCSRAGIVEPMRGRKKINGRGVIGIYPKCELIGSHVGRRSFATNYYYGKMATSLIRLITGHGSEKMLLAYIGKPPKDVQETAREQMLNSKG